MERKRFVNIPASKETLPVNHHRYGVEAFIQDIRGRRQNPGVL